jgi:deoxyadenosine/deoxycytidine kinase
MSERDYRSYQRVFELIAASLPEPDLLIYLVAPPEILLRRIAERGREIETGISLEYLSLLDSLYDDWMRTFNLCPVLKIRSDDLDFVHKKGHLDTVANLVQEKLTGKEEIVF